MGSLAHISTDRGFLIREMHSLGDMGVHLKVSDANALLAYFRVRPILMDQIKEAQNKYEFVVKAFEGPQGRNEKMFTKGTDGMFRYGTRLYMPDGDGLRRKILEEAHMVKAEHQKPAGLLQPLLVPEWKWEHIAMDFVMGLPWTSGGYDSIWIIVDRLMKSAYFLPVKTTYGAAQYARIYVDEIVRLHGIPISIAFDKGP
ncbi:PREDICTED: uncharacterized protein LOC108663618 [Theobroma cacao]|uniref:Uncharacterized protein LOC108663618 n=1 Tax=Theobroma cacao TaxID=3641 RepID=A0AB32WXN5_THECC|nr:PREDICTED: uncharacterized protein LOC108663618 [Theobroma cacao]